MHVPYPRAVSIVEGSHPEVFAANGSHGIWGDSGKFEYSRVAIQYIFHVLALIQALFQALFGPLHVQLSSE